jgi:hypothetical protein
VLLLRCREASRPVSCVRRPSAIYPAPVSLRDRSPAKSSLLQLGVSGEERLLGGGESGTEGVEDGELRVGEELVQGGRPVAHVASESESAAWPRS